MTAPDSAPTATAWNTGVKTNNGVIGVNENVTYDNCASQRGNDVTTLFELAEEVGLGGTLKKIADALGVQKRAVLTASTGVIGVRLPVRKVVEALPALVEQLVRGRRVALVSDAGTPAAPSAPATASSTRVASPTSSCARRRARPAPCSSPSSAGTASDPRSCRRASRCCLPRERRS